MDESRRLAMRRAHAKHTHTCICGKVCRGNGGWASHKWACRAYQTRDHESTRHQELAAAERRDYEHNPARCAVCSGSTEATD